MKRMHAAKIALLTPAVFAAFCLLLGCQKAAAVPPAAVEPTAAATKAPAAQTPPPAQTASPSPTPTPTPGPETVTVRFVGDLMVSRDMIDWAAQPDGTYDFERIFPDIQPYLAGADLLVGNLETPIAGRENGGFTGNPRFNAPDEYLAAVVNAGFRVLTNANNHVIDRGVEGAITTTRKIRDLGVLQTGAFLSEEDSKQLLITEVRGVRICILAYTYHSTRKERPEDAATLAWLMNYNEKDRMAADVAAAREQGADVVLVFTHMGTEGTYKPNRLQEDMAAFLVEQGVDAAIFCHPHAVQPFARIPDANGREVFVAYSLGNFLCDGEYRMSRSGMVLELPITFDPASGDVTIDNVRYMPTYSHSDEGEDRHDFRLYSAGAAMADETVPERRRKLAKISWDMVTEVVGSAYAEPVARFD